MLKLPYLPTTGRLSGGDRQCVLGWFFYALLGLEVHGSTGCCVLKPQNMLAGYGIPVPDEIVRDMQIIYQTNDVQLFEDAFRMMLTFINKHRGWLNQNFDKDRLLSVEVLIRRTLNASEPEAAEGQALAIEFSKEVEKRLNNDQYNRDVRGFTPQRVQRSREIDEFVYPAPVTPWYEIEKEAIFEENWKAAQRVSIFPPVIVESTPSPQPNKFAQLAVLERPRKNGRARLQEAIEQLAAAGFSTSKIRDILSI